MEGPSLVIACEELRPFVKRKILAASGTAPIPITQLKGNHLIRARSWGKHLLLTFSEMNLRIHFLMFGSYRIDKPRANRIPKLQLDYGDQRIYFYSCAIKEIPLSALKEYNASIDLMSKKWDAHRARAAVRDRNESEVCDVLMDQTIFSGLGNIMKNEILFNLRMDPRRRIKDLTGAEIKKLVTEAENYAWQFYEWKKANVLKRNWQIMRKKKCPRCAGRVTKRATGKLARLSHFCQRCQR